MRPVSPRKAKTQTSKPVCLGQVLRLRLCFSWRCAFGASRPVGRVAYVCFEGDLPSSSRRPSTCLPTCVRLAKKPKAQKSRRVCLGQVLRLRRGFLAVRLSASRRLIRVAYACFAGSAIAWLPFILRVTPLTRTGTLKLISNPSGFPVSLRYDRSWA